MHANTQNTHKTYGHCAFSSVQFAGVYDGNTVLLPFPPLRVRLLSSSPQHLIALDPFDECVCHFVAYCMMRFYEIHQIQYFVLTIASMVNDSSILKWQITYSCVAGVFLSCLAVTRKIMWTHSQPKSQTGSRDSPIFTRVWNFRDKNAIISEHVHFCQAVYFAKLVLAPNVDQVACAKNFHEKWRDQFGSLSVR